jgi:hypothetical protein
LFVLAEQKLKYFSQRIADDLPEDMAVLSYVHARETDLCSSADYSAFGRQDGELENRGAVCTCAGSAGVRHALSQGGIAAIPSYQVSFSQHFRQQLLAAF